MTTPLPQPGVTIAIYGLDDNPKPISIHLPVAPDVTRKAITSTAGCRELGVLIGEALEDFFRYQEKRAAS